jgi:hypothetical protein
VILGFLAYAVVLGALLPVAPSVRHLVTVLNGAILEGFAPLIVANQIKPAPVFSAARDAVSLALTVLAYRAAAPTRTIESGFCRVRVIENLTMRAKTSSSG